MPSLDGWLQGHPRIAKSVIWEEDAGAVAYPQWSEPRKAQLRSAFAKAWSGAASGLIDPPALTIPYRDNDRPGASLADTSAFALYGALVGNSLAVEIDRQVPWSIVAYDDASLAQLFDARTLFFKAPRPREYVIGQRDDPTRRLGIPAPPEIALAFLRQHNMIGSDRRSTIVKLGEWCRDNLWHFTGPLNSAKNFEDHWQYRGKPPASRIIAGTIHAGANPASSQGKARHYTAGCWGTTAFLSEVLRTVNIPVQEMVVSDYERSTNRIAKHATPFFMSEGLYLSHGDDLYNRAVQIQPSYPVDKLFIDKATFANWFPPGFVPTAQSPSNVGRRVAEADIQYLPIYLLDLHAQDVIAARPPDKGEVMKSMQYRFTLAELETRRLWQRLDERTAQLGGPEKVRAIYRAGLAAYDRQSLANGPP